MTDTKIQWTDATWNPIRGCSLVSEGCRRCYAMKQAHRFSGEGQAYEGLTELGPDGPRWTGEVRLVPKALDQPLHWKKPARIFVNSMSDLFHEEVPEDFISKAFGVMAAAEWHQFQILTKRPLRMYRWIESHRARLSLMSEVWPIPNIWLGVSVEDQKTADQRIPILLQTPAAVRFISYEPALGPLSLQDVPWPSTWKRPTDDVSDGMIHPLRYCGSQGRALDWVIVGGESGPGARPFNIQWARDIVAQCKAAGVACFVKQVGANPVALCPMCKGNLAGQCRRFSSRKNDAGHGMDGIERLYLADKKGGDMAEWPEDMRVRQFPGGLNV